MKTSFLITLILYFSCGLSQTITVRKDYSDTIIPKIQQNYTIKTKCFPLDYDFGKIDSVSVDSIPVTLKISHENYIVYRFNLQRLYSFYELTDLIPPKEKYYSNIFHIVNRSYSYSRNNIVDTINHLERDVVIYYVSDMLLKNIKTGKIKPLRGSGIKIDKTNLPVEVKFTSYSK